MKEQKNVLSLKDLAGKLTRGDDLVTDFCTETCSTAKACILLNQHRKFVGCEGNSLGRGICRLQRSRRGNRPWSCRERSLTAEVRSTLFKFFQLNSLQCDVITVRGTCRETGGEGRKKEK